LYLSSPPPTPSSPLCPWLEMERTLWEDNDGGLPEGEFEYALAYSPLVVVLYIDSLLPPFKLLLPSVLMLDPEVTGEGRFP
jgi:hypothetical protein